MSAYSNARALRALVKASLQSILKSPSAIVFSVAFPLIFILVFGFLGDGKGFSINVAAAPDSDTANSLYTILQKNTAIKWKYYEDTAALNKALSEGDIAATISIQNNENNTPRYNEAGKSAENCSVYT